MLACLAGLPLVLKVQAVAGVPLLRLIEKVQVQTPLAQGLFTFWIVHWPAATVFEC